MSPELLTRHEAIQKCMNCYQICLEAMSVHCLDEDTEPVAPDYVKLMMDCAEACRTAADFLVRRSINASLACAMCAMVCRQCAEACMTITGLDHCAFACDACADACDLHA